MQVGKGTWKEQRVTMYQAVAPPACPAMVERVALRAYAACGWLCIMALHASQWPNEGR